MPDVYASITTADPATLERLAGALELRAADLLRRGIVKEFVSEIALPKGAKVLEIGCGTGAVTRFLAGLPDVSQAVGVDPSPVFIAKAKELAGSVQNLTFQEADGRALPCEDRSFDAVLFHTTLCHIPKPEEALAEARRIARTGDDWEGLLAPERDAGVDNHVAPRCPLPRRKPSVGNDE
jgi:ubiquinone/menaquinone biosynthesis C-methylase UbiE